MSSTFFTSDQIRVNHDPNSDFVRSINHLATDAIKDFFNNGQLKYQQSNPYAPNPWSQPPPCPLCALLATQKNETLVHGEIKTFASGVTHSLTCPIGLGEQIDELKKLAADMNKVKEDHASFSEKLAAYAKQDVGVTADIQLKLSDIPSTPTEEKPVTEPEPEKAIPETEKEEPTCSECGDSDCKPCAEERCGGKASCLCKCCPHCTETSCEVKEGCDHWKCECPCCEGCGLEECECCGECGNSDCGYCDECDIENCLCSKCERCEEHCGECEHCGKRGCRCERCDDCNKQMCVCERCQECDEHDCEKCSQCDEQLCNECGHCQACDDEDCNWCDKCESEGCECSCEDEQPMMDVLLRPEGAMTVKAIPNNPNCEHCMGMELAGPGTTKHNFMTVHKTDVQNAFLATCNQCHAFWIQDKTGWCRAEFGKEGTLGDGASNSLVAAGVKALTAGGKGGISTMTALAAGGAVGALAWAAAPTLKSLLPAALSSGLLPAPAKELIESPLGQIVINIAGKRTPEIPEAEAEEVEAEGEEGEEQQLYDKNGNPVIIAKPVVKKAKAAQPKPAA